MKHLTILAAALVALTAMPAMAQDERMNCPEGLTESFNSSKVQGTNILKSVSAHPPSLTIDLVA